MAPMNIYHIQDPDRPMWVVAPTYNDALWRWKTVIADENGCTFDDVEDPQGMAFICGGNELLLPLPATP